jgi:DNA repair protein RadA
MAYKKTKINEEEDNVVIDKEKKEIKDVSDLPGVGERIGEKLKSAGYIDLMSIAAASPKELGETANVGEITATKIINTAREVLDIGFEKATKVYERRLKIKKITSGSKNLDSLLGGGFETQAVTEFHGAFGSGKTQIGFQLAVNAQLPEEQGGIEGNCIFLDAEGTFRPGRIKQMAETLDLDPKKVLENIYVARCYNSDHQMVLAEKVGEMIKEKNIKLVIIDSVTSNFRADFTGRGELAMRQQKLNRHLHTLQRLSDVYNVAVYITNQVMSRPDILFGDPTRPIGGHILGHFSTHRLYVRKSKGNTRIARMIDSPNLPEGETVFLITPEGIKDPEEK